MTNLLKSRYLIHSLIIVLVGTFSSFDKALAVVTPPATKCNIRVDDPHISKYILRTRGYFAVKVNARSICDKAMRNLELNVEIYKIGLFRDYQVGKGKVQIQGLIYANKVIKNEKANTECVNQKSSRYYGIAYARAIIDGELRKTLKVTSAKTITLKCGT
jgi:hypothetical protein